MPIGGHSSSVGDNIEFNVPNGGTTVTIYFSNSSYTSDNDTSSGLTYTKYVDHPTVVRHFHLRNNQPIKILSMNGITFSDGISIAEDKGHKESFDSPTLFKMEILTIEDDTTIKIRYRGRT
jgi:hypothetical protein